MRLLRPTSIALACAALVALVACEKTGSKQPEVDETKPVGNVIELAGTVTATRASDNTARPLAKGAPVFADDRITTGTDGSVRVLLTHNNAIFALTEGRTRVLREAPAWSAKKQSRSALDKKVNDTTHLAGRHAEKSSADTAATATGPGAGKTTTNPDTDTLDNETPDKTADDKKLAPRKPKSGERKGTGPKGDTKPRGKNDRIKNRDKKDRPKSGNDGAGAGNKQDKTKGRKCDEVACLIDPSPACCKKYRRKRDKSPKGGAGNLPQKLRRSDISKGVAKIRGRLRACVKDGYKGRVTFSVTVDSSGRVSEVTLSSKPDSLAPAARSCLLASFKRARFPKSQQGNKFRYPIRFR